MCPTRSRHLLAFLEIVLWESVPRGSFARTWKLSSRLFSWPYWLPLGLRGWVRSKLKPRFKIFSVLFFKKGFPYGLLQAENMRSARCSRVVISKLLAARKAKTSFLNMTGAKISTKGIWGMRVDSNPPISVSRPLAVQNHKTLPRTGMFVWSRYVCTRYHTFLHIPLPLLHDYDVKIVNNFTFSEGRKQATTKFSFSF